MKANSRFLVFLLPLLLLLLPSFKHSEQPGYLSVKNNVIKNIQSAIDLNQEFLKITTSKTSKQVLEKELKKCRLAFKKIEHHVFFNYPTIQKSINGGPVYGVSVDVVKLFKIAPSGYQVLEELVSEETLDVAQIQAQIQIVDKELKKLKSLFKAQQFGYWHIFEAARIQLNVMATLSLNGFDSPVFLNSLPESEEALKTVYAEIKKCYELGEDEQLKKEIDLLFENGVSFLGGGDFEHFDRFTFFRDILHPLSSKLLEFHIKSGYEMWSEVSPNKRGFNYKAKSLFAADFLNPYYSLRGKNVSITQVDSKKESLGELLFFDPVLSKNNERACASCHSPNKGFTDNKAKSVAFDFKGMVKRNSPTIINSCYQTEFFWDMRSGDLNDQITHVVESEKEFNTSFEEIVEKLKMSDDYIELFKNAFPNSATDRIVSVGNVKDAVEAYVRSKRAMNSPFDQYIRGENKEVPEQVINGFNLFMGKAACGTCHFPPNYNGLVPPHFNDTEGEIIGVTADATMDTLDNDWGRYDLHKGRYPNETFIKGMFKTPSVRNVALTAPYMHNGVFNSLEEVINFYNKGGGVGLGHNLPSQTLSSDTLSLTNLEIEDLIQFMNALTDTIGLNNVPVALPLFGDDALDKRVVGGVY